MQLTAIIISVYVVYHVFVC